jgi:large subunit ribosomal protein L6
MSRIGKKPLMIPAGVTVTVTDSRIDVKGPKGELKLDLPKDVTVNQVTLEAGGEALEVHVKDEDLQKAIWGTIRANLGNMINGVTTGWTKSLELNGVGYKMNVAGSTLNLSLGFSHDVKFALPEGIKASIKENVLTIEGFDRQLVGQVAAEIRSMKKPEPYKGKGFKYVGENIRRKLGKQAKSE